MIFASDEMLEQVLFCGRAMMCCSMFGRSVSQISSDVVSESVLRFGSLCNDPAGCEPFEAEGLSQPGLELDFSEPDQEPVQTDFAAGWDAEIELHCCARRVAQTLKNSRKNQPNEFNVGLFSAFCGEPPPCLKGVIFDPTTSVK